MQMFELLKKMKSTKVLNPRHHHLGLRLAAVVTQSVHMLVCKPKYVIGNCRA